MHYKIQDYIASWTSLKIAGFIHEFESVTVDDSQTELGLFVDWPFTSQLT